MADEITPTPDSKSEARTEADARITNGTTANGTAATGEATIPGRKMSFEEALQHTLEENAELYRRLAR